MTRTRIETFPCRHIRGYAALVWFGQYVYAAFFGPSLMAVMDDARQYAAGLAGQGVLP